MKNFFTEKDVLKIVESVINEIYTSPTPQPNLQTKPTTTPTLTQQTTPGKPPTPGTTKPTQTKSVGRVDPYVLRDYSYEIAPQLKSMAISLGANRVPVLNMITGIFERLSPQWSGLAKQKFMQLAGMTAYK